MSAIGPGDYVECIAADLNIDGVEPIGGWPLVIGSIYQVRWVGKAVSRLGRERPAIKVGGIVAKTAAGIEGAFDQRYFRPVYRPKSEIIQGLLTPVDERVDA